MATAYGSRLVAIELGRLVSFERNALAIEIVRELQQQPPLGTPVRTGWARANWIATLDATQVSTTVASSGSPAQALGRSAASIAELLAFGPSNPFAKAHVYNPVPYVHRLNEVAHTRGGIQGGHSAQSAPGWIERGVARAVATRQQVIASRASVRV